MFGISYSWVLFRVTCLCCHCLCSLYLRGLCFVSVNHHSVFDLCVSSLLVFATILVFCPLSLFFVWFKEIKDQSMDVCVCTCFMFLEKEGKA